MRDPFEPVMFDTCTALRLADGTLAIAVAAISNPDGNVLINTSTPAREDWESALESLGLTDDVIDDWCMDYFERGPLGFHTFTKAA